MAEMRAKQGDDYAYIYSEVYSQWKQPALAMHWLGKARELKDPEKLGGQCLLPLDVPSTIRIHAKSRGIWGMAHPAQGFFS